MKFLFSLPTKFDRQNTRFVFERKSPRRRIFKTALSQEQRTELEEKGQVYVAEENIGNTPKKIEEIINQRKNIEKYEEEKGFVPVSFTDNDMKSPDQIKTGQLPQKERKKS